MIIQEFLRPQPSLTVTHDTFIYMSMSIKKIADKRCKKMAASEQMSCSQDEIQDKIKKTDFACLPFQYKTIFPKLYLEYQECKENSPSVTSLPVN